MGKFYQWIVTKEKNGYVMEYFEYNKSYHILTPSGTFFSVFYLSKALFLNSERNGFKKLI
jgi:hypothetical protein